MSHLVRGAVALSLLPLAILSSCVDSDSARPDEQAYIPEEDVGTGPYDCAADQEYEFQMLESFDYGAASGSWYANNDVCESCPDAIATRDALLAQGDAADAAALAWAESSVVSCVDGCLASQNITIFDKPLPAEAIPQGGRCGSTHALHLATIPLSEWGANLGTAISSLDGSAWEGISFWARRSQSTRGSIRIELADPQTDGSEKDSGGCNPDYTRDTISTGCDRFGAYASVGSDWEFFAIPFADFRQAGWGVPAGKLDVKDLRSLTLLFPTGTWDLWIDDVALYRRHAE